MSNLDVFWTEPSVARYRGWGIFAHEAPVRHVVDRIERLDPDWIHAMRGGSLAREAIPYYTSALREKPFAYQGLLVGRELPDERPHRAP